MNCEDFINDVDFLWDMFKNTGLVGVYLMYEEKKKEIKGRRLIEKVNKRDTKNRYGKRIKELI